MDRNEWYRAGEDIRDQVQQAVETGNFTNLGKNISNTVNETINRTMREVNRTVGTVGDNVNRTVEAVGQGVNRVVNNVGSGIERTAGNMGRGVRASLQPQSPYAHLPQYRHPNTRPDSRLFQRTPKGTISGVVCMCAGYTTAAVSALAIPVSLAEMAVYVGNASSLVTALILFAGGLGVGIHGTRLTGRAGRYKRYVNMLKDKLYCSIQEMALQIGKSERFVLRDIKKMLRLGMFAQGRLDQQETCLIASNEMYDQYMLTQKNYEEEQKKLEIEKLADERKQQEKERLGEAAEVIEEGKTYVRLIRQCNDEIPGEEMSDKLDRLELLVTRIFEQVEKEPELAPELRKMLSFYLPTTKKLLEAYRDLDGQKLDLSNIEQTKREIETAVDNINEAFEKFLDELFREKAWDIQSDISALHTILKQDGYLN
ncbi:MAG: 5-bromo-4-chloroindolyl phosphate hydrolysis family protein [Bacteroidales bacterium]|nr:5-bromo-4-chloroindolyl phosphate hydrolysis family protein [Bacteroidales bacterium]MCM1414777.1 5-bromo-4-chloroindolyl phosphate hydrolysis family protein [bacterium]MCM1423217.1 5-bromo-4-chloroindolyl phosphate hydrolysis family protein [bacterium]